MTISSPLPPETVRTAALAAFAWTGSAAVAITALCGALLIAALPQGAAGPVTVAGAVVAGGAALFAANRASGFPSAAGGILGILLAFFFLDLIGTRGLLIGIGVTVAVTAAHIVLGRAMAVALSELRRWLSP